jgi:GT2 family glycosyltransferase
VEFEVFDTAEANARRRRFVRHLDTDSSARLKRAYGREAGASGPPRISIIIPTADGERYGYLPRLLEQIEQQTFQNFEVLIAQGDNRQGRAINLAAAIAGSELLLTFDDDTQLGTPDVIGRLVKALDTDEAIGMAGAANRVPPDAGWLLRRIMSEVPRRSSPLVSEITDSDMAEHPCLAMRKEVFCQVGGEHELIPRGLDPYLRREFRRAGLRVVIVPDIWIHHLPPPTLGKALRQFFRNGKMSVLVSRQFPDLALDNALRHGQADVRAHPLWFRAARHAGRMLGAFLTLRWIGLAYSLAYGLGAVAGTLSRTPSR